MQKVFFSLLCFSLISFGNLCGEELFTLVRDGAVNAVILRNSDRSADGEIRYFNDAVYRCIRKRFPLVLQAKPGQNVIEIHLRKTAFAHDDEFKIEFPAKNRMRITATRQSLAFAFNHLLENYFGVRFLFVVTRETPFKEDVNHFPAVKNAAVPVKSVSKKASYNLNRQIDWKSVGWQKRWNTKVGLNAPHMMAYYSFPVYKYAADQSWPVNVLPVKPDGKRMVLPKAKKALPENKYRAVANYSKWNPCFTHPDTTRIAIGNILEYLKKNPDEKYISLAVNDNGNMCHCKVCLKEVNGKRTQVGRFDYSKSYWKWVNNVASAVAEHYPDTFFTALAYREVFTAPTFKLHKNVVPLICFEMTALLDPEIRARRIRTLEQWSQVARNLTIWDYTYGIDHYLFPRIYFKTHSDLLVEFYKKYKVRGIFAECSASFPFEGPKHYVMARKLFDIHTDVEKVLMDYCNHAVGKKSAPYLRKYYQFWEEYWTGKEIRKTNWYKSRKSTYMMLGEIPSHTLALKKGDMKYLRSLMEKVVAYAQTPGEKKRAAVLMQMFELAEGAALSLCSEELDPSGRIRNSREAVSLLQSLPGALKAFEKLQKNPYYKHFRHAPKIPTALLGSVSKVMPFLKDPAVRETAMKLSSDTAIPLQFRAMLKIWMGAKAENLIRNGSFEEGSPLPKVLWNEGGAYRSAKRSSEGDFAFRVPPFCCYAYRIDVDPEKTYLFMFDAYIKKTSIEGNANFQLTTMSGNRHNQYIAYHGNKLEEGRWVTLSGVGKVGTLSWHEAHEKYGIQLMIFMRNFETNDEIYIDNVRAYCLDDVK